MSGRKRAMKREDVKPDDPQVQNKKTFVYEMT